MLFLCGVISYNPVLPAAQEYYASNSNITLLSDSYVAQPGDTLMLGIKFELEKDWHTYWKNPGDAGEGASIEWDLPQGLSASEILWPGPERIPVDPLMTFGYNDEVILLTAISSSETVKFPLTIEAKIGWFTCKDICIPQEGKVDITIKKGDFESSKDAEEIEKYLNTVPSEFPQNYRIQKLDDKYFIQGEISNGQNFDSVYFFPSNYGLTAYSTAQIYEQNLNSFILEIEASKAKLDLTKFEGVGYIFVQ